MKSQSDLHLLTRRRDISRSFDNAFSPIMMLIQLVPKGLEHRHERRRDHLLSLLGSIMLSLDSRHLTQLAGYRSALQCRISNWEGRRHVVWSWRCLLQGFRLVLQRPLKIPATTASTELQENPVILTFDSKPCRLHSLAELSDSFLYFVSFASFCQIWHPSSPPPFSSSPPPSS